MDVYLGTAAVISLVGLLVYFASDGKPSTAGLYAFAVGLLVALEKFHR
jgi:hypothetical protein